VFELLLTAGFVFGATQVPAAAFGFILTAIILGITGLVLIVAGWRSGASSDEADRITSTGIAGTATVTGLTQTGMSLNDQPQVEIELLVQLPGRPSYTAKHKEFVPLILLGRLSSGAPLPVRVDPADPQKVVVDWSYGQPSAAPGAPMGGAPVAGAPVPNVVSPARPAGSTLHVPNMLAGASPETLAQVKAALDATTMGVASPFASADQGGYTVEQLRAEVRAKGIPGTARIDQLIDTGATIGDERLFTMAATVEVPGRAPQQQPLSAAMIPLSAAGKVAVGMTVPVKVHPDNPGLVMFEWDRI
jgi:hypothetical protein